MLPDVALPPRWRPSFPGPARDAGSRKARVRLGAGQYIGCQACGRLLKIEWAVRSIVCSCGARVPVPKADGSGT